MRNKNILGLIPARGNSKGISKKNLVAINNKPLIAYTIESSLQSKYITETYVSSDNDEILRISSKYGAKTLIRPEIFATDEASSESVVFNAIEQLKSKGKEYDIIILLQPTSPLRDEKDIDNAFEKFFKNNALSLISVYEIENKCLKAFMENKDGYIKGISNNEFPFIRRQDLPAVYMSNGAIYIIKTDEFIKNKGFFTSKTVSFIMNKTKSIDIDTKDDLHQVEKHLCQK